MRKGLIILGILGVLIAMLGSFGTLLGGFGGFAAGDLVKDTTQANKGTGVFMTGLLSFGIAIFSLVVCIIGGVSKRASTALSFSLLVLVLGGVSVYLYNGTVQIKPYTGDAADSIQVIKSGTRIVDGILVKPANTTYIRNVQGIYEEVK